MFGGDVDVEESFFSFFVTRSVGVMIGGGQWVVVVVVVAWTIGRGH